MFAPKAGRTPAHAAEKPAAKSAARPAATSGNQARLRLLAARRGAIQTKLVVGKTDDPLEHEADRVADQVMRMPADRVSVAASSPQISRKCPGYEEEEKLRKKPSHPQSESAEAPGIVDEVLRAPGQPLDTATRSYFEPRFGQDFSSVRIHTDDRAAQSAAAIQARAYTVGRQIVFGRGEFSPASMAGRRLLAHEFTHVAQQMGTARRGTGVIARDPAKDVTTVDEAGKVSPGQAKGDGTLRIPVDGVGKGGKGRAVVLIPNVVHPASSDQQVAVDVLLHLHGYGSGYDVLKPGETDLPNVLQPGELRDVDLYQMDQQLLAHAKATKHLIIAVLPQGSTHSDFSDMGADSGAYLQQVFAKLSPALLPKGAVPGHVIVSGHSGGGVRAMSIANERTKAKLHPDVLLFDAINFACSDKEPTMRDGQPVLDKKTNQPVTHCVECKSNEYFTASDWVTHRIRADLAALTAKPEDQAAELKTSGTKFRGLTSESLGTHDTCSYGFWYTKLQKDIDTTIKGLKLKADVEAQLRENFVVAHVDGPHERVLAHGSLEAALKDI